MKLTVIIPTYCRADDLRRCLAALAEQVRSPDEVIVVVRETDCDTWSFLASEKSFPLRNLQPNLRTLSVALPGVVAAMNRGLDAAQGDVVCFTDDDAAPHPDWLQRIEQHFLADPHLGGLGGRDRIQHLPESLTGRPCTVGKLQWFGRPIGNHHLCMGAAREVDILKGVNMSFRRTAIAHRRFDTRMRGSGAQVHFELAFSLALRRDGWRLVYDPAVLVNHYPAPRHDEDQRHQFSAIARQNAVHNETLALLEHLPPVQRGIFLLYAVLLGHRDAFGLAQLVRYFPQQRDLAMRQWAAAMQGRWQGVQTWWKSRKRGLGTGVGGQELEMGG
ncbi:glycosyltransferase family 2 protein [Thermoleptolyngbya sichuanensis A183]|uniref:Glycosyltransferase family 2 protein n=1 Tax=Thermoleptolyngbya sichuanensis A183 TaxID=2737172 RepID=A0A6M8B7H9_9CYAN|nr:MULTISPECIES: glycosyltransferase family 2 protein [Thermoleptolyngbya]QKD83004.1 glycosyltransferase family 2 protein [Thermoleptolyngbya sichuanensis A183]